MGLITEKVESRCFGKTMNLSVSCPDGYEKSSPGSLIPPRRDRRRTDAAAVGTGRGGGRAHQSRRNQTLTYCLSEHGQQQGEQSSETNQEISGKHGAVHKGRYEDYLVEEISPYVDHIFPTIKDRAARYIGGISSGAYTALSIGLRHPELFSKVGGHMPAVDLSRIVTITALYRKKGR